MPRACVLAELLPCDGVGWSLLGAELGGQSALVSAPGAQSRYRDDRRLGLGGAKKFRAHTCECHAWNPAIERRGG